MSPLLVLAYATAGTVDIDLSLPHALDGFSQPKSELERAPWFDRTGSRRFCREDYRNSLR
jgi:hypothetical protein